MSSRIWEKEEIDFIIQNTSMSIIELAKKLNRSQVSVKCKLDRLKIKRSSPTRIKSFLTPEEVKFLKQNYKILSNDELADKLNRSVYSILHLAKKYKLKKDKINHVKFFDIECSPEYCYVLGWLFSDGYISIKRGVTLTIKKADANNIKQHMMNIYHWKLYKLVIKKYPDNEYLSFKCNSRLVAKFLTNKWDLDKKSQFMSDGLYEYIQYGGDDCIRAFLRGLFEGDGCIDTDRPYIRISANISFDWSNIIKLLPDNIKFSLRKYTYNKQSISVLSFATHGRLFCEYIYGGTFNGCLNRKKDRFINYLANKNQSV